MMRLIASARTLSAVETESWWFIGSVIIGSVFVFLLLAVVAACIGSGRASRREEGVPPTPLGRLDWAVVVVTVIFLAYVAVTLGTTIIRTWGDW